VITLPYRAPFNLALVPLGRLFRGGARNRNARSPQFPWPEFLWSDFTMLTPGQVLEMRYGLGRDRSRSHGGGR
jgi:hypothetical protein